MASIYFFDRSEWGDPEEQPRCGSCGHRVGDTFRIGDTEGQVREKDGHGLCGDCIVDLLMDTEAEIDLNPGRTEYAVLNRDRHCFLGELGDFAETNTFHSRQRVTEFLLDQVHNHGHLETDGIGHLDIVTVATEETVTDRAKQAVHEYEARIDEETRNAEIAEEVIAEAFPETDEEPLEVEG